MSFIIVLQTLNPRPGEEMRGGGIETPCVFSDCPETTARSCFWQTYPWFFLHMLWKCQTQVTQGQVTKSRQVTFLQKSLYARHSYTDWTIALKLSTIDSSKSIHKMFISAGRILTCWLGRQLPPQSCSFPPQWRPFASPVIFSFQ